MVELIGIEPTRLFVTLEQPFHKKRGLSAAIRDDDFWWS
jgi:hypothetical protein